MSKSFEEIEVWQKSRELCADIFALTQSEGFSKDYDLKNQINRSAGSAMDNIAEGFERNSNKEFVYFLYVAKGSIGETRSQLHRAKDRGYINSETFEELYSKCLVVSQQLSKFAEYLKKSEINGSRNLKSDLQQSLNS